ncbi:GIY-YIG nuclease family protein [Christiangramia salexigens]|uniref:Endonuclease n=1 Tax=Christiangramia salexigens TaxID=1913577 RepID=A0A1L3J1K1_9FLAO|nr:GIY-YIG nuclease family protein [Christiangramia salexigens]APG59004.1 endonuclease [Christiangramia salexigens]
MFYQGWHTYYTYILTNKKKTVLYTGVTNNLKRRLDEHWSGRNAIAFTKRYRCHYLIHYEKYTWIQEAIVRENELKGWLRSKKEQLINEHNPDRNFLNDHFS